MEFINLMRKWFMQKETEFWRRNRDSIKPSILQFDYLHMRSLTEGIKKAIKTLPKNRKYKIIDVGCGEKPYQSLFAPIQRSYVGVDIDKRVADVIAPAEKLPFGVDTFDIAISFQTLEHCKNPMKVIAEIKRVLKPNGYIILTTHGIWMHHPCPHDYYRWTNEGLYELFSEFTTKKVEATLTSWSALIQLSNVELYGLACRYVFWKLPLYMLIITNNLLGRVLTPFGKKHLSINYVVLARK